MTQDSAMPPIKRVLLKLSGEVLMGEQEYGIDPAYVARLAEEVAWPNRLVRGHAYPPQSKSSPSAFFDVVAALTNRAANGIRGLTERTSV